MVNAVGDHRSLDLPLGSGIGSGIGSGYFSRLTALATVSGVFEQVARISTEKASPGSIRR